MPRASRTIDIKHLTFDKIKSSVKCQVSSVKVKRAFTLIELLVVITIIAILIAAVSASFTNAQQKGRDGKRKSDLKAVQQALEIYMQTYGSYPASTNGVITCSGAGGTGINAWGSVFQCPPSTAPSPGPIFIQQLPRDPGLTPYYYNTTSNFTYILSADLENDNDPDRAIGGVPCTPEGTRDYCVINP